MRTTSTLSRRALGASLAATLATLATAACTTGGGGGQNEPATGSIQQRSGTGTGGGIRGPQVGAGG